MQFAGVRGGNLRYGSLAALACLLPAGLIEARETGVVTSQEDIVELESFQVTASRRPARILEVAEAVTLVNAAGISREAPGVLAEMLRGQTGTFFQQTTPGQGIPVIRGLKGSEVLHLVDGMRLNNAFFRNAPNQYLGLVDAYSVERMEIVRGSAPSLHGADAMGGVVQVLTAEPDFPGTDWQAEGRLYGSFNSVDDSVITRASASAGKEGSSITGGFTVQDFNDRATGGGSQVSPTAFKVRAGDVKWRQSLSEKAELMLSAQVLEQPSTPRIDELVAGYGQAQPSSVIYEFRPNRRSFLHARYRALGESGWFERMEVHVARQIITDDRLTQESGAKERVSESNASELDGLTLQFNTPWGSEHTVQRELIWGLEFYADSVSSSRLIDDTETGARIEVAGRFPDGSKMDSAAVYAMQRWQWDQLILEAGMRYSKFEIRLPATGEMANVRLQPDDLTGDVHASWQLRPGLRLVSNIGRGFRPPNIFDLGTLGSRPGNRFNEPNTDLEPESVWSYDLGLKSAGSGWEAELFVFYSDYRDKIATVTTGEVTSSGRYIVHSENLNQAQLYGIESGLRWRSREHLEVFAAVNYTRGKEQDRSLGAKVPADRIPPLNGRLGVAWTPNTKVRLQPWLDFAGRQEHLSPRDVQDPRINPGGTAGYVTGNMLLSWQANPNLELGLRLQNLGDKRYREHGSGVDAPGRNLGFWLDLAF